MIKILYAGSPDAARITLENLYNKQKEFGFEIAGVLSNPPSAKGRHKELTPTPVAAFALEKNIPVITPEHLKAEARDMIKPLGAELLVSFAYGHIFGPKFLEMFKFGGINLHPSLLPKYRGCTPVPAAILNRDSETAVSIQTLALKMDEGNILAQKKIILSGKETTDSLLTESAETGAALICDVIKMIQNEGKVPEGLSQKGNSSYTSIITKENAKIDWNKSAAVIEAEIRAYYSDPCSWAVETVGNNKQPLKILEATFETSAGSFENEPCGKVISFDKQKGIGVKTGSGILWITVLQRQGKKAMNYKDFMNGARDFVGTVLE